jgi:hypothetical protein
MVFSAGLAAGSVVWGTLAQHVSTSASLIMAAACLLVTTAFGRSLHVPGVIDLQAAFPTPNDHLRANTLTANLDFSASPIRLHIDYNVLEADHEQFVQAIYELKEIRLRNGAIRWGLFQDVIDSTRLSETFIMESWVDYLRQQERLTASDALLISRITALDCRRSIPPAMATIYVKQRSVTAFESEIGSVGHSLENRSRRYLRTIRGHCGSELTNNHGKTRQGRSSIFARMPITLSGSMPAGALIKTSALLVTDWCRLPLLDSLKNKFRAILTANFG